MANRERLRQLKGASKDQLIATILQQENMIANIAMVARNEEIVAQKKTRNALGDLLNQVVPICQTILEVEFKLSKPKRALFRKKFYEALKLQIAQVPDKEPEVEAPKAEKKIPIILQ